MDIIIIKHTKSACLAQPVEHAAVNRSVGGSSPSTGAIGKKPQCGFFPFFIVLLEPPDAVFALHDSRVQISWRKLAIPSRLALLTGVESAGRHHRRRKAIVAEPRALARGFCILSCAKPHRKFFRRGPRGSSSRRKNARRSLCSSFLRNYRTALSFLLRGAASPQFLSFFNPLFSHPLTLLYPTKHAFCGGPCFMPHRKYFRWGPLFYTPPKILSAGAPV